jgi:hypothetical protein
MFFVLHATLLISLLPLFRVMRVANKVVSESPILDLTWMKNEASSQNSSIGSVEDISIGWYLQLKLILSCQYWRTSVGTNIISTG